VLRLWSDQSAVMALSWFLICGLVQVLFLSLVVNFSFFSSYFLVSTLGLDMFSGAHIN